MSYATGGIVLVSSNDCKVIADKLCSKLNDFVWTSDGGEWVHNIVNDIDLFSHYDDFNTKSPTVFLSKESCYVDIKEGESPFFTAQDYSQLFSPYILEGWIEIACTANEANKYVYLETLRINANGTVEMKQVKFDSAEGLITKIENYLVD